MAATNSKNNYMPVINGKLKYTKFVAHSNHVREKPKWAYEVDEYKDIIVREWQRNPKQFGWRTTTERFKTIKEHVAYYMEVNHGFRYSPNGYKNSMQRWRQDGTVIQDGHGKLTIASTECRLHTLKPAKEEVKHLNSEDSRGCSCLRATISSETSDSKDNAAGEPASKIQNVAKPNYPTGHASSQGKFPGHSQSQPKISSPYSCTDVEAVRKRTSSAQSNIGVIEAKKARQGEDEEAPKTSQDSIRSLINQNNGISLSLGQTQDEFVESTPSLSFGTSLISSPHSVTRSPSTRYKETHTHLSLDAACMSAEDASTSLLGLLQSDEPLYPEASSDDLLDLLDTGDSDAKAETCDTRPVISEKEDTEKAQDSRRGDSHLHRESRLLSPSPPGADLLPIENKWTSVQEQDSVDADKETCFPRAESIVWIDDEADEHWTRDREQPLDYFW